MYSYQVVCTPTKSNVLLPSRMYSYQEVCKVLVLWPHRFRLLGLYSVGLGRAQSSHQSGELSFEVLQWHSGSVLASGFGVRIVLDTKIFFGWIILFQLLVKHIFDNFLVNLLVYICKKNKIPISIVVGFFFFFNYRSSN